MARATRVLSLSCAGSPCWAGVSPRAASTGWSGAASPGAASTLVWGARADLPCGADCGLWVAAACGLWWSWAAVFSVSSHAGRPLPALPGWSGAVLTSGAVLNSGLIVVFGGLGLLRLVGFRLGLGLLLLVGLRRAWDCGCFALLGLGGCGGLVW